MIFKKVEKLPGLQRSVRVVIPWKEIADKVDQGLNKVRKSHKTKGFRVGKVPPAIILQKYGKAVVADVARGELDGKLQELQKKEKLKVAAYLNADLQHCELNQDVIYRVEFEEIPVVKVLPLRKFQLKEAVSCSLREQDVENAIQHILKMYGTPQQRTAGTPLKGDMVVVKFERRCGEVVSHAGQDYFEVGANRFAFPQIEQRILGVKLDEETEWEVDSQQDSLATGADNYAAVNQEIKVTPLVNYKLKLLQINYVQPAQFDEKLFKRFKNMPERSEQVLRAKVGQIITARIQESLLGVKKHEVYEQLLSLHEKVQVPQAWIDRTAQQMKEEQVKQVQQSYGKKYSVPKLNSFFSVEQFADKSAKQLKLELLWNEYLNNYVPDESFVISEEDIDKQCESLVDAHSNVYEPGPWHEEDKRLTIIKNSQVRSRAKAMLKEQKFLDLLAQKAKVGKEVELDFEQLLTKAEQINKSYR